MKRSLKQDHFKVERQKHVMDENYIAGRGAQFNTKNRFLANQTEKEEITSIDVWEEAERNTQYIEQKVKSIVNKVTSPDLGMMYSMNPYAGCEHGCIYCYARNVHEYWGYSAGLDFESKIIVKVNAPQVLHQYLMKQKEEISPIMMSGNTDCYQPAEQKYRLTKKMLEVCNLFNQPVGILTKNSWIIKDKDLLAEMAQKDLVSAMVSVTTFNEELRRTMEPRTATAAQRIKVIEELSKSGIRTGVMLGPMIPGLNEHEMQRIMKEASDAGARFSSYTFIRLNGAIQLLFRDWLFKNFPDRAGKVWHLIESGHNGKVNDSRWGVRMRGEGHISELVKQQFKNYSKLYHLNEDRWKLNTKDFRKPGQQGKLF
ncbi:MAG: PA0069 family radical SAM protein [Ginsengibacter sp.]